MFDKRREQDARQDKTRPRREMGDGTRIINDRNKESRGDENKMGDKNKGRRQEQDYMRTGMGNVDRMEDRTRTRQEEMGLDGNETRWETGQDQDERWGMGQEDNSYRNEKQEQNRRRDRIENINGNGERRFFICGFEWGQPPILSVAWGWHPGMIIYAPTSSMQVLSRASSSYQGSNINAPSPKGSTTSSSLSLSKLYKCSISASKTKLDKASSSLIVIPVKSMRHYFIYFLMAESVQSPMTYMLTPHFGLAKKDNEKEKAKDHQEVMSILEGIFFLTHSGSSCGYQEVIGQSLTNQASIWGRVITLPSRSEQVTTPPQRIRILEDLKFLSEENILNPRAICLRKCWEHTCTRKKPCSRMLAFCELLFHFQLWQLDHVGSRVLAYAQASVLCLPYPVIVEMLRRGMKLIQNKKPSE
eukprot:Gb_22622 [translate_table: standard]